MANLIKSEHVRAQTGQETSIEVSSAMESQEKQDFTGEKK